MPPTRGKGAETERSAARILRKVEIMTSNQTNNLAALLRNQFSALRLVGAPLQLDEDRQRRMLLVPEQDWSGWSNFLRDGPLPSNPSAPTMLRRLGAATYRLAALAGRRAVAGEASWTS